MARSVETVELDGRASAYIRERLSELSAYYERPSLRAFCEALDERMQNVAGVAFTIAPVGASVEQLYAFESGGLVPENLDPTRVIHVGDGSTMVPVESLFEEEFARLRSELSRDPSLVCVAADPMPRKGECLQVYGETIFFVGDDVYQCVVQGTSDEAAQLALVASPPWSNLMVLSTVAPKLDADRCADADELRACAGAAVEVSCSAYDGEGFVVWRATWSPRVLREL